MVLEQTRSPAVVIDELGAEFVLKKMTHLLHVDYFSVNSENRLRSSRELLYVVQRATTSMTEMDQHAMTSNLWHYNSYGQPLYPRYCYDHHPHASSHRYQTSSDAIFRHAPRPYCGPSYVSGPPASSVTDVWKVVESDRRWTGHALDRATDAAAAVAAAAHHRGWTTPYSGIGA